MTHLTPPMMKASFELNYLISLNPLVAMGVTNPLLKKVRQEAIARKLTGRDTLPAAMIVALLAFHFISTAHRITTNFGTNQPGNTSVEDGNGGIEIPK